MFHSCTSLTSLNLVWFNTKKVTNFKEVFENINSLEVNYYPDNAQNLGSLRLDNVKFHRYYIFDEIE